MDCLNLSLTSNQLSVSDKYLVLEPSLFYIQKRKSTDLVLFLPKWNLFLYQICFYMLMTLALFFRERILQKFFSNINEWFADNRLTICFSVQQKDFKKAIQDQFRQSKAGVMFGQNCIWLLDAALNDLFLSKIHFI